MKKRIGAKMRKLSEANKELKPKMWETYKINMPPPLTQFSIWTYVTKIHIRSQE